jgi:GTP cyclohydrolase II
MKESNSFCMTASANLPTRYGDFLLQSFSAVPEATAEQSPTLCLTMGLEHDRIPMVRIHSECITGEVFGSLRCECSQQLDDAMARISRHGSGAIIYLRQEGRGIGIENKIKAYALQDQGLDTVEANVALGLPVDARDFKVAANVLMVLDIDRCHLLTNNPHKTAALVSAGIDVEKELSIEIASQHPACTQYLQTKKEKLGHRLFM